MTPTEVRNQIVNGENFTFPSLRKKGRIFTVSAIHRPGNQSTLFSIKGNDLKYPSGIYNENNVLTIIEAALNGKPQSSFRMR